MKKAAAAGALLLVLLAGSLWNIRYLDDLTNQLLEPVARSRQLWESGDAPAALRALAPSETLWREHRGYAHVFIRHSEVDAVSDAFCQLRTELESGQGEGAGGAYDLLLYHLQCIDDMEHVTLGSVL